MCLFLCMYRRLRFSLLQSNSARPSIAASFDSPHPNNVHNADGVSKQPEYAMLLKGKIASAEHNHFQSEIREHAPRKECSPTLNVSDADHSINNTVH